MDYDQKPQFFTIQTWVWVSQMYSASKKQKKKKLFFFILEHYNLRKAMNLDVVLRPITRCYREIISVIPNDHSLNFIFFLLYYQGAFTLSANLKHSLPKMWQKAVRNCE